MRGKIPVLLFLFLLLISGYILISGNFLKMDEDRDIIKYNGRIYSNATELEWFDKKKSKFQKGKKLGEIKKHKNTTSLFWGNLTANKLQKEQYCIKQIMGKVE
ncbi:hypothetical protein [Cytobacillus praedii]|uniref:Uncharacterized protein n=1 Tax=Cytobacillus praedii TaxID=1742358 RepID=A0A4R1AW00_9BACI|nr:hypothetical protein [Cytobacillus praedii]TCJ04532.1 hypothetical protein E0Y62_08795 [Cytobacillus praedii]